MANTTDKKIDVKDLNIYEKMSFITTEMAVIEKNLKVAVNAKNSYKAVSERDVLDNVKPLEAKYRVYSYPLKREITDKDTLVKETEYNGNITRTNTLFMRLNTIYRFINMDKPEEYIDIDTFGDGLDTGDKAPGKAMTYADKYALMKAYKISTGDDPDKDASPEQGYRKTKTIRKGDEEINLDITKDFMELLNKTETDIEELLKHYGVENYNLLSDEQKIDAIGVMKKKLEKMNE